MNIPRIRSAAVTATAALILCSFANAPGGAFAYTQQPQAAIVNPDRERGVELFQKGDVREAIKALREATKKRKDDAEAWHFLGTALIRNNDVKDARKAFERALKLRPDFAATHYNLAYISLLTNKNAEATKQARRVLELDASIAEAHYILGMAYLREQSPERALAEAEATIKLKPSFAPAYLLKSQTLINLYATQPIQPPHVAPLDEATRATRIEQGKKRAALLKEAADSLEQYLKLTPAEAVSETWREQLETLRFYGRRAETAQTESEQTTFVPSELTRKARILSRTEPQYTQQARSARISGTVILRAVFAADGKVKHILVLRSLPHGLTEAAVRAARGIKFEPAMKDGRPVSQFIQIEYNFSTY